MPVCVYTRALVWIAYTRAPHALNVRALQTFVYFRCLHIHIGPYMDTRMCIWCGGTYEEKGKNSSSYGIHTHARGKDATWENGCRLFFLLSLCVLIIPHLALYYAQVVQSTRRCTRAGRHEPLSRRADKLFHLIKLDFPVAAAVAGCSVSFARL